MYVTCVALYHAYSAVRVRTCVMVTNVVLESVGNKHTYFISIKVLTYSLAIHKQDLRTFAWWTHALGMLFRRLTLRFAAFLFTLRG